MILRHGLNNLNYDYDECDYEEAPVHVSYLHDEEEDEYEETTENVTSMDDDMIMEGLSDARISTKKCHSTTMKKKKKIEKVFEAGENVIYRKKKGVVMFGPYEKNYKQVYELQLEDGTIASAISNSIKKIK